MNRLLYFDIARVIAMLWVVGWWHLIQYSISDYNNKFAFFGDEIITVLMLSAFFFIFGWMLGRKDFSSKEKVISFYKTRFYRFYILFSIAAVTYPIFGLNKSISLLFTTLSATSSYILPQPITLWFLSMLASFYIFTPFIKKSKYIGGLIFLVIIILNTLLPMGVDLRLFIYYPVYVLGMYFSETNSIQKVTESKVHGLFVIILSVILFFCVKHLVWLIYPFVFFGILAILYISRLLENPFVERVIEPIAYGSLCAYLFHRPIYSVLRFFIADSGEVPLWVCIVVFLPICLIVSYFIQSLYDYFMRHVKLYK